MLAALKCIPVYPTVHSIFTASITQFLYMRAPSSPLSLQPICLFNVVVAVVEYGQNFSEVVTTHSMYDLMFSQGILFPCPYRCMEKMWNFIPGKFCVWREIQPCPYRWQVDRWMFWFILHVRLQQISLAWNLYWGMKGSHRFIQSSILYTSLNS